jgi:hypothetical protein
MTICFHALEARVFKVLDQLVFGWRFKFEKLGESDLVQNDKLFS